MNTSNPRRTGAVKIREVKPEIRVLGVDDSVFKPHSNEMADVVGVVFRGGYWLDGFMHTKVHVDGMDATEKLVEMVTHSPHYPQLRVVMLNGITLAGFNIVDIKELYEEVKLPTIAVTRDKPDFEDIKKALQNLPETEKRWNAIEKAGKMIQAHIREGEEPIYVHVAGVSEETARRILMITSTRSNIPEALRVAHIIASGLGRA
jgi:endonuclease V-like protein UPF0215 family